LLQEIVTNGADMTKATYLSNVQSLQDFQRFLLSTYCKVGFILDQ